MGFKFPVLPLQDSAQDRASAGAQHWLASDSLSWTWAVFYYQLFWETPSLPDCAYVGSGHVAPRLQPLAHCIHCSGMFVCL